MTHQRGRWGAALAILAVALVVWGARAVAQDAPKSGGAAPQPAAGPQPPKPGPEHAALAKQVGSWDASVDIKVGPPGAPPQHSKGIETSHLCCGGLWLVTEFKSDPSSSPFEGHGIIGYDTTKKKYVGVWVDTDGTTPMISEGTYDTAARTMTLGGSAIVNGKTIRWRETDVWKDDNTRQFTMYMPGQDGEEVPTLNITYTRRK